MASARKKILARDEAFTVNCPWRYKGSPHMFPKRGGNGRPEGGSPAQRVKSPLIA